MRVDEGTHANIRLRASGRGPASKYKLPKKDKHGAVIKKRRKNVKTTEEPREATPSTEAPA